MVAFATFRHFFGGSEWSGELRNNMAYPAVRRSLRANLLVVFLTFHEILDELDLHRF